MALDPNLEDYRYEIKENLGRRAIALFFDLVILFIPLFIFTAIFIFVIFQANPMSLVIGQLAPLIYPFETVTGKPTPIPLALIPPALIFSPLLTIFYFTTFEKNGRRTLGKMILHLELHRSDGRDLTTGVAFRRNLAKHILGALGLYLLGLLGWGLFIGIGCFLDLRLGRSKKPDVRQRLSEASLGTMVYVEHDYVPYGEISIPGQKIEEKKEKKKAPKLSGSLEEPSSGKAPSLLGKPDGEKKRLPGLKRSPKLLAPSEEKEEKLEQEPALVLDEPEVEKEEEEMPEEERPKKTSFFSKLFGGGKKAEKVEETQVEVEEVPGPDDLIHIEGTAPKEGPSRDETILQFMFDFDVDENRASSLYEMGYRVRTEFADAIPEDLMMIEGVNPTIAKRIIARAKE